MTIEAELARALEERTLQIVMMTEAEIYHYRGFVQNAQRLAKRVGFQVADRTPEETQTFLGESLPMELKIIDVILENGIFAEDQEYKRGFARGFSRKLAQALASGHSLK